MIAIVATALLFDPVRKWIQERIDQFFYRTGYDYRKTLIEFGRELSSETDLDKMLSAVVDRLSRTLLVDRMAVFLSSGETSQQFVVAKSFGMTQTGGLDLSFLGTPRPEDEVGHLFFDNTHQVPRETLNAQQAIARLDLNYYIPCRAQKHTIAVSGLGQDRGRRFPLQRRCGIAGDAGRLSGNCHSERPIVRLAGAESCGIRASEGLQRKHCGVDQRWRAGGRPGGPHRVLELANGSDVRVASLAGAHAVRSARSSRQHFVEEFYRVRQNPGIHNLYKFRLGTPTGESRVVNVAIAPLVTKEFSVIGRLIIMDDITERIELEAQLSQADKLSSIGLLAAGVAHEVNTPLAVISSYAQMLSKQLQGDAQKGALLEKITRQTFRASEIVNNLLNFSRTSGTEFTAIDVNRVISGYAGASGASVQGDAHQSAG